MTSEKQLAFDKRYLQMAKIWGQNSYAIRRQVGCLIVKNQRIISDGYNGTPSGFENICEDVLCTSQWARGCLKTAMRDMTPNVDFCRDCKKAVFKTKSYVLHAEANAISKIACSTNNSDGATLYVTDEPCLECSKMIIQSGITRVVYSRDYHSHEGIDLLRRANIKVEQIVIE